VNAAAPPLSPHRQVRVVLSRTALLSFASVWRAAASAIGELGVAAFFIAGVARSGIGESAPWIVLAAWALGVVLRAIDIESWALFVPGGLIGRVEQAFGARAAGLATAAALTERLLLAALACVLIGQYAVSFTAAWIAEWGVTARLTVQELVVFGAIVLIGLLWTRARLKLVVIPISMPRAAWAGIGVIAALMVSGAVTLVQSGGRGGGAFIPPLPRSPLEWLAGLALVLPVIGGGEALARAAHEFAPPRLQALGRTSLFVIMFGLLAAVLSSFLFLELVPPGHAALWTATPLAGVAQQLPAAWLRGLMTVLIAAAAFCILAPSAYAALDDASKVLQRLWVLRSLSAGAAPFLRLGAATASTNIAVAGGAAVIFASSGQVTWLSKAYGFSVAAAAVLKIAALIRLRSMRPESRPFITPFNVRLGRRQLPLGLGAAGLLITLCAAAMLVFGDLPSMAAAALIVVLTLVFSTGRQEAEAPAEEESLELLPSAEVSLGQAEARPGNVLVAVRHPHSLSHVMGALDSAGDRDVVVMTVRLLGVDVDEEAAGDTASTREERYLFAQVVAMTERRRRPVRLLIVPARNVFDGVVAAAVQLRSSEIYVGESSSLSADEQARLLGDAWERAEKPKIQQVRLVIYRSSGRTDSYHLGAHPPSLTPADLDLIHRVWLDASKVVGPHVHHHDVVRAALTQMEHQLSGSQREEALAVIRSVARPADELAAAVHGGNYSRLRDLVRNRHAGDIAEALTEMSIEDQVVVFRILPRKDAAAVFEYLNRESQEALLKAMAQEDVAALLNNMAPDDRTMFLEELPAAATRRLLSLLTPAERSVALTLLGYPEGSVGRLMTPHYVSVNEHWTIREVLDHIRTHGQDSETLNVVYVVDEQELLMDDIRIRELLLTSLDSRVSDLMDRRFVALKATDDQETAVALFRQYDRTALPVTDTDGTLIGIVTIDDVLDVAEAAATKEIQRIGGSEALEEPYMRIAFGRMIRKRAGWLTALFLGETLTAAAMGLFEGEIQKLVVLALFIPLIISSGGNSGSQAATLVVRALALGEVTLADWWRVIRREALAGLSLGAILGAIGFLRITIWSAVFDMYKPHAVLVATTVGLSLIGVVMWGTLVGSLLPLLLRRLGFDPATSSAPFVATLVDVTGLIIYFSVALLILPIGGA